MGASPPAPAVGLGIPLCNGVAGTPLAGPYTPASLQPGHSYVLEVPITSCDINVDLSYRGPTSKRLGYYMNAGQRIRFSGDDFDSVMLDANQASGPIDGGLTPAATLYDDVEPHLFECIETKGLGVTLDGTALMPRPGLVTALVLSTGTTGLTLNVDGTGAKAFITANVPAATVNAAYYVMQFPSYKGHSYAVGGGTVVNAVLE